MNKTKISLLSTLVIIVLAVSVFAFFMQNSGIGPHATLVAYATGTPDAKGNHIVALAFYQNTTGTWSNVGTLTNTSYVPNYNLTIPANQHTLIELDVELNSTLAPDAPTSITRTRVYVTIGGVVTNASMIALASGLSGSYWHIAYYYPSTGGATTWVPATDTTYTITFYYQAYY